MTRRQHHPRGGFTLIEIMVVILIIGVLVTLTVTAAGKVRDKARQATAASEMAQLGNAVAAFKTKFNMHIPAFTPGQSAGGSFRLASSYIDSTTSLPLAWPEVTYLKQVFPQMDLADNGLRLGGQAVWNGQGKQPANTQPLQQLDPNQVLVFFLSGSTFTNFAGFSTNRSTPFATPGANAQAIGPFLDMKAEKLDASFHYLDPWGNPYAYLAFDPALNAYPNASCFGVVPYNSGGTPVKFYNQKSNQIVSAGRDGQFGPGGTWAGYALGSAGADDLSNFSTGPLAVQD